MFHQRNVAKFLFVLLVAWIFLLWVKHVPYAGFALLPGALIVILISGLFPKRDWYANVDEKTNMTSLNIDPAENAGIDATAQVEDVSSIPIRERSAAATSWTFSSLSIALLIFLRPSERLLNIGNPDALAPAVAVIAAIVAIVFGIAAVARASRANQSKASPVGALVFGALVMIFMSWYLVSAVLRT